jgi:rhamnopyranosyl-N-acetylglucosaminyl-diphospho-decaprenol beta-1,3/1,4-galactofuranosyltransferase
MKVLAAVVTHNRCKLLQRCIDHINAQTRKPDSLLIVNNASTDGTLEMLQANGISFVTQENVGSAGGWYSSIQAALDEGFDAVWLMDDDGFPDMHALQELESALTQGVACASSVVVKEDAPTQFVFPFPVLNAAGLPALLRSPRKIHNLEQLDRVASAGKYPFAHFFNGTLINLQSVRKIGNVDRGFFIFGEEVDYFFRLRSVGPVISVLNAIHYHPDVSQRPYTSAKVYYYLKNTIILNQRYFDWPWLRHCLAVLAVLTRTAKRNGWAEALSYLAGRRAPVFYSAIIRGLSGKVGKDFNA